MYTSVKIEETILEILKTLHKAVGEDGIVREVILEKVEDLAGELFATEMEKN